MSSIKRTNHDTNRLPIKDKSPARDLTVLQKYLANNHTTAVTNRPEKETNKITKIPLRKKSIDSKPQSRLPLSAQKQNVKTQILRSDKSPKKARNAEKQKTDLKESPVITVKEPTENKDSSSNFKDEETILEFDKNNNSSDDEQLLHMNRLLDRFRNSKPLSREKRSNLTVKNLTGNSSSSIEEDNSSEDETPDLSLQSQKVDENKELALLKKQLNSLRQKMFNNQKNLNDFSNEFENETSVVTQFDYKPQSLDKNHSKDDEIYGMLNIEALDLKAKYLIEKSENSLIEKANSSDGVGSSRSSSVSTSFSSNFQEPQPYKPEFLKYLENKNKLNHSPDTGEELKPEQDILYQWRLRRKMEEARKNVELQNFSNTILNKPVTLQVTSQLPVKATSNVNIEEPKPTPVKVLTEKKQFDEKFITKTIPTEHQEVQGYSINKQTIETQTSILIETVDPNFLKPPISHKKPCQKEVEIQEEDDCEIEISIYNEEPTRDNSNYLDIAVLDDSVKQEENNVKIPNKKSEEVVFSKINTSSVSRHQHKKIKNNFLASSPIRETIKKSLTEPRSKIANTSLDFTKISVISDNTPQKPQKKEPTKSNSPLNFEYPLVKNKSSSSKQYSLETCQSNQLPSVISSVSSTITNVTDSIPLGTSVTNLNKLPVDLVKSNRAHMKIDTDDIDEEKNLDNTLTKFDKNSTNDNDFIDSDEILRILFKKSHFYKLKLKQIDELLIAE